MVEPHESLVNPPEAISIIKLKVISFLENMNEKKFFEFMGFSFLTDYEINGKPSRTRSDCFPFGVP